MVKSPRLKKDKTPYKSDTKKVWFDRRTFSITSQLTENFLETYTGLTNYIMTVPKKMCHFWQSWTNCFDYGKCPYLQLCMHGENQMQVFYKIEDPTRSFEPMTFEPEVKVGSVFKELESIKPNQTEEEK